MSTLLWSHVVILPLFWFSYFSISSDSTLEGKEGSFCLVFHMGPLPRVKPWGCSPSSLILQKLGVWGCGRQAGPGDPSLGTCILG